MHVLTSSTRYLHVCVCVCVWGGNIPKGKSIAVLLVWDIYLYIYTDETCFMQQNAINILKPKGSNQTPSSQLSKNTKKSGGKNSQKKVPS